MLAKAERRIQPNHAVAAAFSSYGQKGDIYIYNIYIHTYLTKFDCHNAMFSSRGAYLELLHP